MMLENQARSCRVLLDKEMETAKRMTRAWGKGTGGSIK